MGKDLRPEFKQIESELASIAALGSALWADPDYSERVTLETLTAVLMLDLSPNRMVDRLTEILVNRAQKEGIRINVESAMDPFFRLQPEERFILMGLHRSRWSYERLGKVLGMTPEKVQETAWAARLHLVYLPESARRLAGKSGAAGLVPQGLIHPTGSLLSGSRCPDYHPGRPWTQRFLDDECMPREKHFLIGHLQSCDGCRKSLGRARTFYYTAEKLLPEVDSSSPDFKSRLDTLGHALRQAAYFKYPGDRSIGDDLRSILRRTEMQWVISAAAVISIYLIFR